jgi:hypothetical protein
MKGLPLHDIRGGKDSIDQLKYCVKKLEKYLHHTAFGGHKMDQFLIFQNLKCLAGKLDTCIKHECDHHTSFGKLFIIPKNVCRIRWKASWKNIRIAKNMFVIVESVHTENHSSLMF